MADRLKLASFRLPDDILEGIDAVRERDGVPGSEQVRRALRVWLADRGVGEAPKPAARPSKPSKRSGGGRA